MTLKMYDEFAEWWPLLSRPDDYAEEAKFYGDTLRAFGDKPARTLLELGSGGGNNASFLKRRFEMTLVEPAAGMRRVSRALNPEAEHLAGDMRGVRLDRQFDRVFVHDAICYMTTLADLRRAMETAFIHCRVGGAALFAPDYVAETYRPGADQGGHDGEDQALRYLEWRWDPDPDDCTYLVDYAYLLRSSDGSVRAEHDRHEEGLFPRAEWLRLMTEVGFSPSVVPFDHSELESGSYELFVGVKEG